MPPQLNPLYGQHQDQQQSPVALDSLFFVRYVISF